jgi:hypothetical protein
MLERSGMKVVEMRPLGGLFAVIAHKLNTYLAFNVAGLQNVGRLVGKMGHEASSFGGGMRYWTLPAVLPSMLGIAWAARVLDKVAPDPTEALGYVVVAQRVASGGR